MRRNQLLFSLFLVVFALLSGTAAMADDQYPRPEFLERARWWPHETGPHYGEVDAALRDHPRTLNMPVGSFDTRTAGMNIHPSLRMSNEAALRPGTPWLVQLTGPITAARKKVLTDAGATIHRFFPVNTFLVRANDPAKLAKLNGVLWAGPYHPAYRIEPAMGQAPTIDPIKALNETISVRVRLFDPEDKSRVMQRLETLGAVIDHDATNAPYDKPNRVYFTATPQTILAAARMDDVSWVEEISREGFTQNGESHIVMQSGSMAGGTIYWNKGVDGSTQVLGVMDTGMDVDTILLSHTTTDAGTPGPSHRKVRAYTAWGAGDFTTCSVTGYTHGTNTSQCAVANRSDFGQPDTLDGVANGAKIVFQDVGAPGSCGIGTPSSMQGMYDEIRSFGGQLTNGSFVTCAYGSYGSGAFDLDEYGWDHRDFLAFYSGGNGGGGNACPGTNKNHISSGGHYQFPFQNQHYGSTGPSPSGRMGPTILGPACDHAGGNPAPYNLQTSASIRSDDNDLIGFPASDVIHAVCGTSFSSPYLTGLGALIRDYFEKGYWPTGASSADDRFAPSAAMVKAVLINSGDFVENCIGCTNSGLMGSMGMGRVNLSSTLTLENEIRTPPGTRVVDRGMDVGLQSGEIYEQWLEVLDTTEPLKITLVWVDQPGSLLTNDLRLTVTGPAGTANQRYFGNNFGTGAYSISQGAGATDDDTVNVFESVRIDPAELVTGNWIVQVRGSNVPMGDPAYGDSQPFALIAAGGIDSLGINEVSPIGSVPLLAVSKTATEVTWEWEPLGDPSIHYSFYRGTIGSLQTAAYDHEMIDGSQCGISGNTTTVADVAAGEDTYYLVAGHRDGQDGPLGDGRPDASPDCP